jgi:hypothetical protein
MYYSYFWLYQFYKKQQLHTPKLLSHIFPQNKHVIYFSQKLYHINRLTKQVSHFSETYTIYYAFYKILAKLKIK